MDQTHVDPPNIVFTHVTLWAKVHAQSEEKSDNSKPDLWWIRADFLSFPKVWNENPIRRF